MAVVAVSFALAACGDDGGGGGAGGSGASGQGGDDGSCAACEVPPGGTALIDFLEAGDYSSFAAEAAPHSSEGPHFGDVQVYFSPKLAESLAAGNTTHPAGSATVKELYGNANATEPEGWSVWVKLDDDSADGDNIYWFEIFGTSEYADGTGETICVGCHGSGGVDFLLSPAP